MSKLVALFALLALVQVATAYQCYFCRGDDCTTKTQAEWQKTPCKPSVATESISKCAVIKYKEKSTDKELIKRSCEIFQKDKHDKCSVTDAEVISCSTCESELCNSAPAHRVGGVAAIFVCTAVAILANKVLL